MFYGEERIKLSACYNDPSTEMPEHVYRSMRKDLKDLLLSPFIIWLVRSSTSSSTYVVVRSSSSSSSSSSST